MNLTTGYNQKSPYILKGKSLNKDALLETNNKQIFIGIMEINTTLKNGLELPHSQMKTAIDNRSIQHVWLKKNEKDKIEGQPIFQKNTPKTYFVDRDSELTLIGWYRRGKINKTKVNEQEGIMPDGQRYDKRVYTTKILNYYYRGELITSTKLNLY